jgi:photosystem II stability/assembly factor-like uncharacterized protein
MKRLITALAVVMSSAAFAQFSAILEQSYGPLTDLQMVNAVNGYAGSWGGSVLRTADGGETWTEIELGVENDVDGLHFMDVSNGVIGGEDAYLAKTTDGGATWTEMTLADETADVVDVYFASSSDGWALASNYDSARFYSTTDGGSTWSLDFEHTTGDLEAIDFFEGGKGIAVGGGNGKLDLYYTTDGTTWNAGAFTGLPPVYTRTDIRGVKMLSATDAIAVGWGSRAAGLQPSIIMTTTDGGANWEYVELPEEERVYVNLYGLAAKDANNLVVVGGAAYEGTTVIRSTDGGASWSRIPTPGGFTAKSAQANGDNLVVVGSNGGILTSTDFGDSWTLRTPIPGGSFYQMVKVNDNVLYAAGYDGVVAKTTDGGVSWTGAYAALGDACPTIRGIHFVDENVGYAARNNKSVAKTTDGGATWTKAMQDSFQTGMVNYGVYFFDADEGFVVGKLATGHDVIYHTTDGGGSWTYEDNVFYETLQGIVFVDASKGMVVGENLAMGYTTDGGGSWNYSTVGALPSGVTMPDIEEVAVVTGDVAVAVGDEVILKTTDAGANWASVTPTGCDTRFDNVYVEGGGVGYAVGGYDVWKTTDAGDTWTIYSQDEIENAAYCVATTTPGGVLLGSGGATIYADGPVDVDDREAAPNEFTLAPNYPNPFNPTTVIEFTLPRAAEIELTIYNAAGEAIEKTAAGRFQAGTHTFTFDADGLASGVYFFELRWENGALARKMTLLK